MDAEVTLPLPSTSVIANLYLVSIPAPAPREPDLLAMPLREAREHFERVYLTLRLAECGGKVGALAQACDMERTHMYRKLRALGIPI